VTQLELVSLERRYVDSNPWVINFQPGLNLLIGEPNTSKSTTLRIVDFCLGQERTAETEFGTELANEYESFVLTLKTNGTTHVLTRRLRAPRETTRVDVDGSLLDSQGFNEWISQALEWPWPPIMVPRGINRSTATYEDPLTFRALLRHIYRNADSWTRWADQEQEFLRRAVVAFFLGVGEELYRGSSVQVTQREQQLQALTDRRRELRDLLDHVVRQVSEGYEENAAANLDSLRIAQRELDDELASLRAQRVQLASEVRRAPDFRSDQDVVLADLEVQLSDASRRARELDELLREQRKLIRMLDADLGRIERARLGGENVGSYPVHTCPNCLQSIEPLTSSADTTCYVCHQPIQTESLSRRLELESQAIASDRDEVDAVVTRLGGELHDAVAVERRIVGDRRQLLDGIERDREEFVAPRLSEFERLQHQIGRLEQRMESLRRLEGLNNLVAAIDAERQRVASELQRLEDEVAAAGEDRATILDRCNVTAQEMNQFQAQLPEPARIGGLVDIDPQDMGFYVGRGRWDHTLGEERRVVFFLAYHYALYALAGIRETPFPRLAILDNPFQQDVPERQVEAALDVLATSVSRLPGTQLIVATRRELPSLEANRIRFNTQFNPQPFS
jgi:hypothetical protein